MKRFLAIASLVLVATSASASAADPTQLDISLSPAAAVAQSSVFWIATSGCRANDCDVLLRTNLTTRKTSAAKHVRGVISALDGAGSNLVFSEWNESGKSAVYLSTNGSKFRPVVKLQRHGRHCLDSVVAEGVSPEGAVAWTRYINGRCSSDRETFIATTFARWPGGRPRKIGNSRRVSLEEGIQAIDIQAHVSSVAIRGSKLLQGLYPQAVLYDFANGSRVTLSNNGAGSVPLPTIALGPGGQVLVSHMVSKKLSIQAPQLYPYEADLTNPTLIQEPLAQETSARFCGDRLITWGSGEPGVFFNVRNLFGVVTSRINIAAGGEEAGINAIYCDDTTAVIDYFDPDGASETGDAVYVVKLP